MATPKRSNGKMSAALKTAATILTTTGFFAAAVFLAAVLWLPANAAPPSAAVDVQPSMLLALDKPERPVSKLHMRDLPSLTDEEKDTLANLPSPDLVTELNDWTYTSSFTGGDLVDFILASGIYTAFANAGLGNTNTALYYANVGILAGVDFLLSLGITSFGGVNLMAIQPYFQAQVNALVQFAIPGVTFSPHI